MHSLVVHMRSSDLLLLFPALPQSCVLDNKAKQESGLIQATVCYLATVGSTVVSLQPVHCWGGHVGIYLEACAFVRMYVRTSFRA